MDLQFAYMREERRDPFSDAPSGFGAEPPSRASTSAGTLQCTTTHTSAIHSSSASSSSSSTITMTDHRGPHGRYGYLGPLSSSLLRDRFSPFAQGNADPADILGPSDSDSDDPEDVDPWSDKGGGLRGGVPAILSKTAAAAQMRQTLASVATFTGANALRASKTDDAASAEAKLLEAQLSQLVQRRDDQVRRLRQCIEACSVHLTLPVTAPVVVAAAAGAGGGSGRSGRSGTMGSAIILAEVTGVGLNGAMPPRPSDAHREYYQSLRRAIAPEWLEHIRRMSLAVVEAARRWAALHGARQRAERQRHRNEMGGRGRGRGRGRTKHARSGRPGPPPPPVFMWRGENYLRRIVTGTC